MQTPDGFISLAAQLRGGAGEPEMPSAAPPIVFEDDEADAELADESALLRDVRLFRARIAEALEESVRTLLCDIAADVLARELQLAPADIAAIVQRVLERYAQDEPLRIRAHPAEAPRLHCTIPVVRDTRLGEGDVAIELCTGTIVSSLGLRLDAVLGELA